MVNCCMVCPVKPSSRLRFTAPPRELGIGFSPGRALLPPYLLQRPGQRHTAWATARRESPGPARAARRGGLRKGEERTGSMCRDIESHDAELDQGVGVHELRHQQPGQRHHLRPSLMEGLTLTISDSRSLPPQLPCHDNALTQQQGS